MRKKFNERSYIMWLKVSITEEVESKEWNIDERYLISSTLPLE